MSRNKTKRTTKRLGDREKGIEWLQENAGFDKEPLFVSRLYEPGGEATLDLAGELCLVLREHEVRKIIVLSVTKQGDFLSRQSGSMFIDLPNVGHLMPIDSESDFFRAKGWPRGEVMAVSNLHITAGWIKVESDDYLGETFLSAPDIDQAMFDFLKQCQREGSKRE